MGKQGVNGREFEERSGKGREAKHKRSTNLAGGAKELTLREWWYVSPAFSRAGKEPTTLASVVLSAYMYTYYRLHSSTFQNSS